MNEHDSERLAGLLEVQGYRKVDSPDDASVAVFNTCASTLGPMKAEA